MDLEAPAQRLKRARESIGLDQHAAARLIGIDSPWYYDLEEYEDEIVSTLSLEKLCHLAHVLSTDPLVLLVGDRAKTIDRTLQFEEIVQRLADEMSLAGLDVKACSERVGWNLTKILADPQELWNLNTGGFVDVTKAAGVEWTSALPRTPRPASGERAG